MLIRILSVGKIKEKFHQEAIEEYTKRLNGYVKLENIVVADESIPDKASLKEEEKIKQKEGERLLQKIKSQDFVLLLDIKGKEMDSVTFSSYIEQKMSNGISSFTFIIGGSLGVSEEVRQRANERISLSKMTFTHPFSKVILMEQLYRAFKIMHHETYHK